MIFGVAFVVDAIAVGVHEADFREDTGNGVRFGYDAVRVEFTLRAT